MEPRKEIAVELSALSELLSGISRQTPYRVPDGYFQELPARVLGRLVGESPTFRVPAGYFDGLAAQVLGRIKAGPESGSLAGMAGVGAAGDGTVGNEAAAGERVSEELLRLSATVSQIGREMPFRLPEGYFDELSPVLTVARDIPAYRAPEGYFSELPAELISKATAMTATMTAPAAGVATIIPIEPVSASATRPGGEKVLKGQWWKYSSVAAVAACLLLIVNWPQIDPNSGSKKPDTPNIAQRLENVSDQEIMAYLDDEHSFVADPAATGTATLDLNEGDVKSLLGDVSDSDLQQYVEEHGKAEDIATN
jgi:hypothetical protein